MTLTASLGAPSARAQAPKDIEVGLLMPLSGLYARFGASARQGAEMAVEKINKDGGIKALGGAKLKLIVLDCGDTAEKAKSAAQRMVADYPNMVAVSGSYLSTLTLATSEVTERAHLPMLTLSYSDLMVGAGDSELAELHTPAISVQDWDQGEVGSTAATLLLSRIRQTASAEPQHVLVQSDFIERASMAPPRTKASL